MSEGLLAGKVAIVTGSGSTIGIGRAMTLAMVRAGARVAMMDIDKDALDQSASDARELGGRDCVLPIVGDVSNPDDAAMTVQRTIAELGGLHILVNNAGINASKVSPGSRLQSPFWEIAAQTWTRVVMVNFSGPFFMARAAVGQLLAQRWGRIIGVTTSLDTMYLKGAAPYGPSKAGQEAFVATIAQDLEGSGVTANTLVPGGSTNTNLLPLSPDVDRSVLIQPEVMQAPVVWLASEESNGINGRRFIARNWDESLPLDQRLEKAGAPAAWPQLGNQAIRRAR